MRSALIFMILFFAAFTVTAQNLDGCKAVTMLKPTPFLGTANEIIVLSDGSIWENMSYQYLYLYAYNPKVIICPAQGKMYLDRGDSDNFVPFTVIKIK